MIGFCFSFSEDIEENQAETFEAVPAVSPIAEDNIDLPHGKWKGLHLAYDKIVGI